MPSEKVIAMRALEASLRASIAPTFVVCALCGYGAAKGLPSFLVFKDGIPVHGNKELCAALQKRPPKDVPRRSEPDAQEA